MTDATAIPTPRSLEPAQLLALTVPVMVQVAEREMRIGSILQLCAGSIIEFETPADAELELYVNNQRVAHGVAVKVGENFGLRITRLVSRARRAHACATMNRT